MTSQATYWRLFQRYQAGTATVAELEQLRRLLTEDEGCSGQLTSTLPDLLLASNSREAAPPNAAEPLPPERFDELYKQIADRLDLRPRPSIRYRSNWLRAWAALLIVGTCFLGLYLWHKQGSSPTDHGEMFVDITPGNNPAILTLPDGRQIPLRSSHDGIGIDDGKLVYNGGQETLGSEVTADVLRREDWLRISVPSGGTYRVMLPDGSQVWLNSGTTLRYPVAFLSNVREVELDGEAYFSVRTQNRSRQGGSVLTNAVPFHVKTRHQLVEVLGTEFNVEAYVEMPFSATTLVEGSVRVRPADKTVESQILLPGHRAELERTQLSVQRVDVERYTAWKSGYFKFDGDLEGIMEQVARWYDVEVEFEGLEPASFEMQGLISRDKSLKQLLRLMNRDERFSYELIVNDTERRLVIRAQ